MNIKSPCCITSRLLPGVLVGGGEISIDYAKREGREGRTRYQWHVDCRDGEFTGDDLQSGCQGGSLQEGLCNLLAFLAAFGESEYGEENGSMFPAALWNWAHENCDEISMLGIEIEETEDAIVEEE